MARWMVAAALAVAAVPTGANAAAQGPVASDAWVRLPAASGRPAAGFFMLKAGSAEDALVGASSAKAERIELHSMTMTDGVMRMRAEQSFALPMKGSLAFQPGGNHLMLFGISPDVKPGDKVPITLEFRSGDRVQVQAEARSAGAPAQPVGRSN